VSRIAGAQRTEWGNAQGYGGTGMTHRLNLVLLVLIALVSVPYYWLLLDNPDRGVLPQPVTIAELRQLANQPGPRPQSVGVTIVGWSREVGNLHAAGSGMKRRLLAALSFRLPVPGAGPIVIDTGVSAEYARAAGFQRFMRGRQRAVEEDMRAASLILATQETGDHLSGLAAFAAQPESALALTRAILNTVQVPSGPDDNRIDWPAGLLLRPALSGSRPTAVAPGVVVIPSPGPSPGAQMVYVRLENGREYLFAGEVAPFAVNFQELRVRSRFLCQWRAEVDRAAVMRWLVTIAALRREAPGLIVVPGRDYEWIADPKYRTWIENVSAAPRPAKLAGN
jgi:glyoxylase-like metal-dependent hydrolase (beta-lactamase superfamily II)